MRKFMHFAFFMLLLVALSGVFMRTYPFLAQPQIPYDNVLHAHSHLGLLGWEFLAVFIIFLAIFWKNILHQREAITICVFLVVVSLLMFLAFLLQGYSLFSIILSTLHIFVEYWAALFIYRQMKEVKTKYPIATLYMYGALLALVISSIGPYALAFISANGWTEYAIFEIAVYFYLHFQYNGWLTLFLFGVFLIILQTKNIFINRKLFQLGFWIYSLFLFPSFLLSVLWVEEFGTTVHIVGALGGVGQWAAIITILYASHQAMADWRKYFSALPRFVLSLTFFLLFVKSTMELGLISPSLATLVYETRSIIIGYLHLTLLGFITVFLFAQLWLIDYLAINIKAVISFTIFLIGFGLNELLLFLQGLWSWLDRGMIPFYIEGLLIAAILLTIGVITLWFSLKQKERYYETIGLPPNFTRKWEKVQL